MEFNEELKENPDRLFYPENKKHKDKKSLLKRYFRRLGTIGLCSTVLLLSAFRVVSAFEQQPTLPIQNPVSSSLPSSIIIRGDEICITQTSQALNLLREKAPVYSDRVNKYIKVIECTESGSGMFAWENPPRFKVGLSTRNAGPIWYAGAIVHDAKHSELYNDYLSTNPTGVPDNIWTGERAENECLNEQADTLKEIGADSKTLDYMKIIGGSGFWNIDYNERTW